MLTEVYEVNENTEQDYIPCERTGSASAEKEHITFILHYFQNILA